MASWLIETEGGKITLQTPYDPGLVTRIKRLPGRRWDPKRKLWKLPLAWEVCLEIRKMSDDLGADLRIGPKLMVWATEEKVRRASIPDVMSFDPVELPRLASEYPETYEAIKARPFQTVGASFMAKNRCALQADHPGLGKTLQTIAAVVESGLRGPILVVAAPKSAAVLTWPKELQRWAPGDIVVPISGAMKPAQREAAVKRIQEFAQSHRKERMWVVTSPNYIRMRAKLDDFGNYAKPKTVAPVREALGGLFEVQWAAIVVDEAHKTLSGVTSTNRKKWSAQRLGLDLLQVRDGGLKLALSGTPFRGKEHNVWGILQWCRPDLYRSGWAWIEKHFRVYNDGYGQIIGSLLDEKEFYQELKQLMIRRTKAEVAPDLPPKMYGGERLDSEDPESPIAVWLPMDKVQAKAYYSMVDDACARLEGGTITANGVLSELTRLRQFACSYGEVKDGQFYPALPSNKFDWIVDFLDERGIDKDLVTLSDEARAELPKIMIASQFTKLLNLFKRELEALGIPCHILTGETSEAKRLEAQEDWQENPSSVKRVFLLNMVAGGASLTLDAADDAITVDESHNRDDEEQVEDRIHRISRMHQVTIWRLRSLGTIEESIATSATLKEHDIKSIIDGQRGVEFVQHLLSEQKGKKK